MIVTELRTVAFIENEYDTLILQWLQSFLIILFMLRIKSDSQLLNGRNNYFIGIIVRQHPANQCFRIGVLLDAIFLKLIELLAGLTIQVFSIHDEQTFVDIRIVFHQGGSLERSERLTAARRMPDIAVSAVLMHAIHNRLYGINLIRTHNQQLLLARDQYHIKAYHLAEFTFGKHGTRKGVEIGYFRISFRRVLIHRKELFVGIEREMLVVIICEIICISLVADNE